MLANTTDTRFLSSTKRFAIYFFGNPLRASRVPVALYAVSLAVDSVNGDEAKVLTNLSSSLRITETQAQKLVAASMENGLVYRKAIDES